MQQTCLYFIRDISFKVFFFKEILLDLLNSPQKRRRKKKVLGRTKTNSLEDSVETLSEDTEIHEEYDEIYICERAA